MHPGFLQVSIPTMTEVSALRAKIRQLYPRRAKGDITEKAFQRELAERTVDLYRALIKKKIARGESILKEHHVVRAHFRLTQSVLREPEQEAISIFAMDRRLFRLKSTLIPDQPPTVDNQDKTVVDEIPFNRIMFFHVCRQRRLGEIGVGVAMGAIAVLFSPWLSITGPFLIVLGAVGIMHGLLMPTRWVEVKTLDPTPTLAPIIIYALRKKSARNLVRFLKERVRELRS